MVSRVNTTDPIVVSAVDMVYVAAKSVLLGAKPPVPFEVHSPCVAPPEIVAFKTASRSPSQIN